MKIKSFQRLLEKRMRTEKHCAKKVHVAFNLRIFFVINFD